MDLEGRLLGNRYEIIEKIGNSILNSGKKRYLQFTELGGRHSVLERPLSEA